MHSFFNQTIPDGQHGIAQYFQIPLMFLAAAITVLLSVITDPNIAIENVSKSLEIALELK